MISLMFMKLVCVILIVLAIVTVATLVYINYRAHRLMNKDGSFRAWMRPDSYSGWTNGVGLYGVETLSWYKLVGFSSRPVVILPRRHLSISGPIDHSPAGDIVVIRLKAQESRYEIAVARQDYNGLVSWVESGPPQVGIDVMRG